MLTKKQIRRLSILDDYIYQCTKCDLRENGIAVPYWNKKSKFAMIAEAPGEDEVDPENETPLVGSSGKLTFKILKKYGLNREDFLILNVIQCRPVNSKGGNGKPSVGNIINCRFWTNKYLEVFNPKFILLFGNFALDEVLGMTGITKNSGKSFTNKDKRVIVPCIHPASVLYNRKKNMKIFNQSIKNFSKLISNRNTRSIIN